RDTGRRVRQPPCLLLALQVLANEIHAGSPRPAPCYGRSVARGVPHQTCSKYAGGCAFRAGGVSANGTAASEPDTKRRDGRATRAPARCPLRDDEAERDAGAQPPGVWSRRWPPGARCRLTAIVTIRIVAMIAT